MRVAVGFDRYRLVRPPASGFWRVSSWDEPFYPPPPPPPVGHPDAQEDDASRWDDPEGEFRTLYCATEAEGALGESLGDFVPNTSTVLQIEAFLEGDPDDGYDESFSTGLHEVDVEELNWSLANVPAESTATLIDVDHPSTYVAATPALLQALFSYGVARIDRKALLDERRNVTRTIAGVYHDQATDDLTGDIRAAGLKFTSRLPPAWECWALWEPFPLHVGEASITPVTIETPALIRAAELLGVVLFL